MALNDFLSTIVPFVVAGFLLGTLPMLAGLGVCAVIHIFKNV